MEFSVWFMELVLTQGRVPIGLPGAMTTLVGKFPLVAGLSAVLMCGALTVAKGDDPIVINASVTSSGASFIEQTATIPDSLTEWDYSLLFSKFNANLGTLNSITLTIETDITTVITVTNNAASASNGSVQTRVRVWLKDPGNLIGLTPQINTYVPEDADSSYDLDPGESMALGPYTGTGYKSNSYTSGSMLSEFTGNGQIALALSTLTATVLENQGGNTASSQVTSASGSVTLAYNYSAVPEPSTVALAVLGAAAVLVPVLRRRMA